MTLFKDLYRGEAVNLTDIHPLHQIDKMDDYYDKFESVPGFPGYTCNRKGEIRGQPSKANPLGKLLKPSLGGRKGTQRLKVALCKDDTAHTTQVHRVIGLTFLGSCPYDGWSIDHIDPAQPLNNHISNLRWASPQTQEANKLMQKDNTSGAKGLVRHTTKTSSGWQSSLRHNGTLYRKFFIKKWDAFEWLRSQRIELGLSVDEAIFGKFIPEIN